MVFDTDMIKLMQHQVRFGEIVRTQPRFAWFAEPGCGKTIGTLAVVNADRLKTLVLAPLSILRAAWLNDAKHFPDLRAVVCSDKSPAERRQLIATAGANVLIANYDTFKRHVDDFLAAGVRRLVVDESSKIKSHTSQISRACWAFADQMESVFLLSGTPAPNSPTEYFSQYRTMDRRIFGDSFYRFANRYFYPIKRTIQGRERVIGWKMIGDRAAIGSAWGGGEASEHPVKREFMAKLKSASWSLRKRECVELPPTTDVIRDVELSSAERRAYEEMKRELRVMLEDGRTLNAAAAAKVMKLRQITGGEVIGNGTVAWIGDSKLAKLEELLEELGDRQVVIFAEFTHEIDRIAKLAGGAVIDGRTPLEQRTVAIEAFQRGEMRRLVCHPAAAGHGITLTAASHAVFYSLCDPPEYYIQSKARLDRVGQTSPVTFWHLIATNTIDEKRLARLRDKRDASDAIFDELGLRETCAT